MRRGAGLLCAVRGDRGRSAYRPRFRPRRLVMPVNPDDVHSPLRSSNPLYEKYKDQQRLRKRVEREGAVTLASVPAERSVGDAFRLMLEVCERDGLFSKSASLTPKYLWRLEELLKETVEVSKPVSLDGGKPSHESPFCALGLSSARDALLLQRTGGEGSTELKVRRIDSMWRMLDNTPLDSPVHGVLALRGKAIVENFIANMALTMFPRLRSKHLQALLHECCGLLACGRVALRLGFADLCGVGGEIFMWRELNVLTERLDIARRKAAAHLQRIEKGVPQQRRWYWKAVVRAASGRLKLFPVHQEDLLPRMEWIRASIFAFIAFIEMAEVSGDGVKVEPLVHKLFCSQLASFAHVSEILDRAQKLVEEFCDERNNKNGDGGDSSDRSSSNNDNVSDTYDASSSGYKYENKSRLLVSRINEELQKFRRMTEDELEVMGERIHPLNARADARRDQFESSGGAHATQSLRDDIFDDYRVTRHHKVAPPIVLHSIRPQNALKEAQIILRYDPNVPASLSSVPIDVDQVVRRVTEVHETNSYATLYAAQQYRQVEYTVCRLYAGKRCIGQGKGESVMEAINEAAQHTLLNYYLKKGPPMLPDDAASHGKTSGGSQNRAPEVRVNEAVDEEIIF